MTAPQEKPHPLLLPALLLAALALRLWWLQAVDTQPVTDFDWYYERAKNLASGLGYTVNGHPTAYWPPGYPLFLAAFFKLAGPSVLLAKLLNIALTLLVVYQTHQIARRLHPAPAYALAAAALIAVLPHNVAYSTILASDPLYTALVLAATLASLHPNPNSRNWLAVGALSGLATLVRPQALLIPFILVAVAAFTRPKPDSTADTLQTTKPNKLRPVLALGIALLALTLVQIPWTLRNLKHFHTPVFVSTNGGDNLWIGHNPLSSGRYLSPAGRPAPPAQELANDKAQKAAALAYLKENPARFFEHAGPKLAATFLEGTDVPYWAFQTQKGTLIVPGTGDDKAFYKWTRSISVDARTWTVALALVGTALALLTPLRRTILPLPLAMVAYTAFLAVTFFGNPRFALPALPFLALLVAIPLAYTHDQRQTQTKAPPPENSGEDESPSNQPDLNTSDRQNP